MIYFIDLVNFLKIKSYGEFFFFWFAWSQVKGCVGNLVCNTTNIRSNLPSSVLKLRSDSIMLAKNQVCIFKYFTDVCENYVENNGDKVQRQPLSSLKRSVFKILVKFIEKHLFRIHWSLAFSIISSSNLIEST